MTRTTKIKSIIKAPQEQYVYDLCCSEPHTYISNGFVSHNCVVLIDEVEKAFASQNDTGVSSSLLGTLLWWLQEHKSRVFVVMTTNKKEVIPKELWREGRIDKVLTFQGLESKAEALDFADEVFLNLAAQVWPKGASKEIVNKFKGGMITKINILFSGGETVPQVKITQEVQSWVKEVL